MSWSRVARCIEILSQVTGKPADRWALAELDGLKADTYYDCVVLDDEGDVGRVMQVRSSSDPSSPRRWAKAPPQDAYVFVFKTVPDAGRWIPQPDAPSEAKP